MIVFLWLVRIFRSYSYRLPPIVPNIIIISIPFALLKAQKRYENVSLSLFFYL